MPLQKLSNFVLLNDLKLIYVERFTRWIRYLHCVKTSKMEVCPRCASQSFSCYDSRTVKIKDSPIRHSRVVLVIRKRRFWCKTCEKPFTEPVEGILPKRRTTQRFRTQIYWACENFSDLNRVRSTFHVSNHFIYTSLYEKLELNRRMNLSPWPKNIGIDEHNFRRKKGYGKREFVTMIVDHNNKRLKELVLGKTTDDLRTQLSSIPGRENVQKATIDMCDPYKNFITEFFPNAQIIADKFHVLRLLTPVINRKRKEITGDKRTNPVRFLLLKNRHKLKYYERSALDQWLKDYPELNEIYQFKEALHRFYRIKSPKLAEKIFTRLTDQMALSKIKEIKTLRRTLRKWRIEILRYFTFKITNARTEGFNNVAKVIKRRSYGFRSFKNYRLRLLNACC